MKIPKDLKAFIDTIKTQLLELLDNNLFGIYIYGSISYGNFEEHRSDVDIIVVTKHQLNKKELRKLRRWYNSNTVKQGRWTKRLEMDYAVLSKLVSDKKYGIKTARFADGRLYDRESSEAGNPITWINIRDCGISLFGPKPKEFVPKISNKKLFSALKSEFEAVKNYADEGPSNLWGQVYNLITLCRIVYTFRKKKLISKKEAGKWGLKHLPKKFYSLIRLALEKLDNFDGPLNEALTKETPNLINYVNKLFTSKEKDEF